MPDDYYSDPIAPLISRRHGYAMEAVVAEAYLETLETNEALQELLTRLPQLPDLLSNYAALLNDTASGLTDEINELADPKMNR